MVIKVLNEPGQNGIVYTKECMDSIVEQLKNKEVLREFGQTKNTRQEIDALNVCCSTSNYRIEDNNLVADVKFVGENKKELEDGKINYSFGLRATQCSGTELLNPNEFNVITFDLIKE